MDIRGVGEQTQSISQSITNSDEDSTNVTEPTNDGDRIWGR